MKRELKFVGINDLSKLLEVRWFGDHRSGEQTLMILTAAKKKEVRIKQFCLDGVIIEVKVKPVKYVAQKVDDKVFNSLATLGNSDRANNLAAMNYTERTLVTDLRTKTNMKLTGLPAIGNSIVALDLDNKKIWMNAGENLNALIYDNGVWAKIR